MRRFHFKFYENRNLFFAISLGLFLLGFIMLLVNGVSLDIQFKGGAILKYGYVGTLQKDDVGRIASDALGVDVETQETFIKDLQGNTTSQFVVLNIAGDKSLTAEMQTKLNDALIKAFPENDLYVAESYSVDPFYGNEFFQKGLLAVGLASLFIVIYVWIRFNSIHGLSAGVFALVALLHDVLMVFITFIVFRIPINDAFIAVVLTIIGYSINDTIVIYDRMRENQHIFGKKIFLGELVNLSQNQSFTRTLNTSINTFFSMVVVVIVSFVFNLVSIRNFALPMMVGIISGCYSTLFIACPLWVLWNTRGGRNMPVMDKAPKRAEAGEQAGLNGESRPDVKSPGNKSNVKKKNKPGKKRR